MADVAATVPQHPHRDGFVAGFGCALVVGLVLALFDGAFAAGGPGGVGAVPTVLGLWAPLVLGFGLYAGALGAGLAAFGPRPLARLRDDARLDAGLAAAIAAAAILLFALAVVLGPPLKLLVVKAKRAAAGANVMGIVAVAAVIGLAGAALPLQRLLRRATAALPVLGPLPRTATVAIVAGLLLLAWARRALLGAGFEVEALPLGALALLVLLPVGTIALAALAYGPLAGARARLPARGAVVGAGARATTALAVLAFGGQPSAAVADSVTSHGVASRLVVQLGQALIDRDRDGYSAFFRGPDCDDRDPAIHPGAIDIPGNGIDENCAFGDAPVIADAAGGGLTAGPTAGDGAGTGTGPGSAGATVPAPAGPRRNVLVIVVDTLRADRFGAAGYARDGMNLTPRMDELLGQSVWFRRAYAQANNTPRSMPSFLASRYASQLAVDKMYAKYPVVGDANETLFEQLQASGWRTIGIASHFYFRPERNVTQGFDEFDNEGALDIAPSNKDIAAPRIVPKVEARLAELARDRARPFAMFVHLFEPHSSWMEHEGMPAITGRGTAAHAQRYDYEIAFVDRYVGKILDALAREGLADDTVVVLLSDHGEAFGEHSFAGESMFHGTNLYDEQLRVPLAFRVPGATPRQLESVVQLVDMAPTVAELVGVPRAASWVGRSLAPAIRGEALPPAPAFAELLAYPGWDHELKTAIAGDGGHKLIHVISQRRFELYDLAADPGEKTNLWGKPAAREAQDRMTALMAHFVDTILGAR